MYHRKHLSTQTGQVCFSCISLFPANVNLPPYGKKPSEPNLWGSESRPPLWQRDPLLVCEDSAVCQSPFLTGLLLAFPFIQGKANTLWTGAKRCVSELGRTHMLRACHMLQKLVIIQFLHSIWDFLSLVLPGVSWLGKAHYGTCELEHLQSAFVSTQGCHSPAKPFLPSLPATWAFPTTKDTQRDGSNLRLPYSQTLQIQHRLGFTAEP